MENTTPLYKDDQVFDIPNDKVDEAIQQGFSLNKDGTIPMFKENERFDIPQRQVPEALQQGFSIGSKSEVDKWEYDKSTPALKKITDTLGAFTKNATDVGTFGLAPLFNQAVTTPIAEALYGKEKFKQITDEKRAAERQHPTAQMLGKITGAVTGGTMLPGTQGSSFVKSVLTGAAEGVATGAALRASDTISYESPIDTIAKMLNPEDIVLDAIWSGGITGAFKSIPIGIEKGKQAVQDIKDFTKQAAQHYETKIATKKAEQFYKPLEEQFLASQQQYLKSTGGKYSKEAALEEWEEVRKAIAVEKATFGKTPQQIEAQFAAEAKQQVLDTLKLLDSVKKNITKAYTSIPGLPQMAAPIAGWFAGGIPGAIAAPALIGAAKSVINNPILKEGVEMFASKYLNSAKSYLSNLSAAKTALIPTALRNLSTARTLEDDDVINNHIEALSNPSAVVERMKQGEFKNEWNQALTQFFPIQYEVAKQQLIQDIISKEYVDDYDKLMLTRLTGVPYDETYSSAILQQINNIPNNQQQQQPQLNQPAGNGTSKALSGQAGKIQTKGIMTDGQYTANRKGLK
jgi:hypothetical protein